MSENIDEWVCIDMFEHMIELYEELEESNTGDMLAGFTNKQVDKLELIFSTGGFTDSDDEYLLLETGKSPSKRFKEFATLLKCNMITYGLHASKIKLTNKYLFIRFDPAKSIPNPEYKLNCWYHTVT